MRSESFDGIWQDPEDNQVLCLPIKHHYFIFNWNHIETHESVSVGPKRLWNRHLGPVELVTWP